ncbi:hypothetical protein SAMN04488057_104413 [Cyclobacterium lianum]|uniref:GWxTD domain-containing protein n=1 Tax=Cyclobacterium lianum TaxID=388280 RepID=A0A1M7MQJ7_9BACT|nr:hypothetical protein [Cyclobacterium lianum]SHM92794.1 hypothetical protein SAMN04488057_104413 [Cyclobacterium lianum]
MSKVFGMATGMVLAIAFPLPAQEIATIPKEDIAVQLSNRVVLTEELLWLDIKVWAQNEPSPSKVIYMELLDREGVPVIQDMANLNKGRSQAYLEIPSTINSDHYLLRVYTRISPFTSGSEGVFQGIIAIINPEKPPTISDKPRTVTNKELEYPAYPGSIENSSSDQIRLTLAKTPWTSVVIRKANPTLQPEVALDFEKMYGQIDSNSPLIPELYGHIIKGRVLDKTVDPERYYYLTAHGKQFHLFISRPDSTGTCYFETGNFRHYDYVVIQASAAEREVNFILDSPFWEARPSESFELPELIMSPGDRVFLEERLLARASHNYFLAPEKVPRDSTPFQFVTDFSYLLDDYNRFDDMATVIREYVPTVLVRSQNRKTIFKNFNIPFDEVFRENPLLLIDGMPVFESDDFAKFNPKNIRKMDIINRNFYIKDHSFSGMVSLSSFENDFGRFDLPEKALFIEYKGVQQNKKFRTEIPLGEKESHLPDFRNILYWGHANEAGHELYFTPSALKGPFIMNVQYRDSLESNWENKNYLIDLE